MLLSNCAGGYSKKKLRFIKKQEATGLLNNLELLTPISLFRMGPFDAAHGCCGQKKSPPQNLSHIA